MHIGMIGGIGPASTVAYYQRLSAAVSDGVGVLDLTIVNANVNELLRNNEAGDKNAQAIAYAKLIDRLAARAECAVITSLGEMALASECSDTQRAFFIEEGRKLIDQGAEAIVLAGTDLNLAFDGRDVGYNVIDALDVHVTLLTDLAVGRAYLNEHKAGLS